MKISNYYKYNKHISTSGLPKVDEFELIKKEGYDTVLSLSMPTDSITVENEDLILTNLGIVYLHIPVDFYEPKIKDFETFRLLLDAYDGKKLWIHCTKNYRVSAFMYLCDLIGNDNIDKELLEKFWMPNETWQQFVDDVIEEFTQ